MKCTRGVVENVNRKALRREINTHVEPGAMVYTDALRSYNDLHFRSLATLMGCLVRHGDRRYHDGRRKVLDCRAGVC